MPGDIAYFVYMAIFGLVIGAYILRAYRGRMGTMVQQALIWILIFLAAVIIYGFKEQLQRQLYPSQGVMISDNTISLTRARDGHFYADLLVNGVSVEFVIDTGASEIVLATQDAEKIGMPLDQLMYLGIAETANGEVRTAQVILDTLEFSGMRTRNVRAFVSEGQMSVSLLGMAYLRRFSRIEIIDDTLLLHR
ncbi:MAG: TIGR02281 family clan AA aspartic protease [Rhodobacteraceae bacterium]|nr:MAG: TIGR02281 family clan AA aspartic protease [Paracoccaceae bacterium]